MTSNAKHYLIALATILFLFFFVTSSIYAETIQGKVIKVVDGDTIVILDGSGSKHRIRFAGIDAPEWNQLYGKESTENLRKLLGNRVVVIEYSKYDKYNRVVGNVLVDDIQCQDCVGKMNIGLEQIRDGLAWHYKKYQFEQKEVDRKSFSDAEIDARSKNLGLWADKDSIAPWKWRKRKK